MRHLDPVLELDFSTGIDGYAFECLTGLIVGLAAALQGLQNSAFINASGRVGRDRTGNGRIMMSHLAVDLKCETHLKRLMRSNISSLVTSGYFLCSRNASMGDKGSVDETSLVGVDGRARVVLDCHLGGGLRVVTGITKI